MSKDSEREKLTKVIATENFEETCEDLGFTVCRGEDEIRSKKKANI